ncbi:hypothetical protein B0H10DRAFT_2013174 [Mycena sp. CBHHK59/15]|nr:hypothetical protein B0H10DRAFT_2013174 [Mycena sp. CBHHK59/15]
MGQWPHGIDQRDQRSCLFSLETRNFMAIVSLHEKRKETGESAPGKTEKEGNWLRPGRHHARGDGRPAARKDGREERNRGQWPHGIYERPHHISSIPSLEIQLPPRPPTLENAAQRTKKQKAEEKTKPPSRDSRSLIYRGALP